MFFFFRFFLPVENNEGGVHFWEKTEKSFLCFRKKRENIIFLRSRDMITGWWGLGVVEADVVVISRKKPTSFSNQRKFSMTTNNLIFSSTHRNGDIDSEIPVVSKELRYGSIKDQAIWVQNGWRDTFVNWSWCGFPC